MISKIPAIVMAAILTSAVSGFAQSPAARSTSEETKSKAGVTPTPEPTEDVEELNDWTELSPDKSLLAVTRVMPDRVYIQRHDLDSVAVAILRVENVGLTVVARHDFQGRLISHVAWESRFKVSAFYDSEFWRSFAVACSSLSILYERLQLSRCGTCYRPCSVIQFST
jgi:hypothetical protein